MLRCITSFHRAVTADRLCRPAITWNNWQHSAQLHLISDQNSDFCADQRLIFVNHVIGSDQILLMVTTYFSFLIKSICNYSNSFCTFFLYRAKQETPRRKATVVTWKCVPSSLTESFNPVFLLVRQVRVEKKSISCPKVVYYVVISSSQRFKDYRIIDLFELEGKGPLKVICFNSPALNREGHLQLE